jgi:Immunity protein Imm1
MKIIYSNQQDKRDPLNGSVIGSDAELTELLEGARTQKPFFIRLSGDNGFELMNGIAGDLGCVQHSCSDGSSPNLLAVSAQPPLKRGYVEFLTANTPTPVAARYIISFDELKQIVLHFLHTGERSNEVVWQKFYPRALKEDAERPAE